jgi:hypothetical protein
VISTQTAAILLSPGKSEVLSSRFPAIFTIARAEVGLRPSFTPDNLRFRMANRIANQRNGGANLGVEATLSFLTCHPEFVEGSHVFASGNAKMSPMPPSASSSSNASPNGLLTSHA